MAMNDLIGVLILVLLAVFWFFVVYNPWAQSYWHSLITRAEYLRRHSQCLQGQEVACCVCGATGKLDLGLLKPTDYRRRIVCANCKSTLWREDA